MTEPSPQTLERAEQALRYAFRVFPPSILEPATRSQAYTNRRLQILWGAGLVKIVLLIPGNPVTVLSAKLRYVAVPSSEISALEEFHPGRWIGYLKKLAEEREKIPVEFIDYDDSALFPNDVDPTRSGENVPPSGGDDHIVESPSDGDDLPLQGSPPWGPNDPRSGSTRDEVLRPEPVGPGGRYDYRSRRDEVWGALGNSTRASWMAVEGQDVHIVTRGPFIGIVERQGKGYTATLKERYGAGEILFKSPPGWYGAESREEDKLARGKDGIKELVASYVTQVAEGHRPKPVCSEPWPFTPTGMVIR